ncbi:hypothetical protein [Paraburkholderia caledonica]|uniref:hypothetical protein n=1 Tax=Paraburkholderia caledonica TaxID=134536 RepID=UPI0038B950EE
MKRTTRSCSREQSRRSQAAAPALLTLDHHTDTYEAFFRHRYHAMHKAVIDENQTRWRRCCPG